MIAPREAGLIAATTGIGVVTGLVFAHTPLVFLQDSGGQEQVQHIFWPQVLAGEPVPFSINNAGTPDIDILPDDPALDEFEAMTLAFEAWESVPGVPVDFDLQLTDTAEYGFDGENVIFFADLGLVGYGGITLITFDNQSGEILDVDIHMNDNDILWMTSANDANGEPLPCPCEGQDPKAPFLNDVQGLSTHEVGHALGLDHSAVGRRESAETPTMYPNGIWDVPGDPGTPPNSYYRTIELDDALGLQSIYPPAGWDKTTARIEGIVHNRYDTPLFGAQVVARNADTGVEVGVMSGVLSGPFDAAAYAMRGLPAGTYDLRAEGLDGTGPGFVGVWNFGGIVSAVIPVKFPATINLPTMYHWLTYDPDEATPVTVVTGATERVTFRPVATVDQQERFVRIPRPQPIDVALNTDETGPLDSAQFLYSIDGRDGRPIDLSVESGLQTVTLPKQKAGTLIEYTVDVTTSEGDTRRTAPWKMQTGLSSEALILLAKHSAWTVGVVDSRTLFEVDQTPAVSAFPIGLAFHEEKLGIYSSGFGYHEIAYYPMFDGALPLLDPLPFDQDGDRLLDVHESIFGTDVLDPDTDGDLATDGAELSEFVYNHPEAGSESFTAVGGVVASDGTTPIGSPFTVMAIWNVTTEAFETSSMWITESGRLRLKLPSAASYNCGFWDAATNDWVGTSADFSGSSGQTVSFGLTSVALSPPDTPVDDSGTDPLDDQSGAPKVFLPSAASVTPLEPGADCHDVALTPGDQGHLFTAGHVTHKVYKLDTATNDLVGEATVGAFPLSLTVTPDGSKLYVTNTGSNSISVVDATTMTVLKDIPLTAAPRYIRMTPDGTRCLFTADDAAAHFIDVQTDELIDSVPLDLPQFFVSQPTPSSDIMLAGDFRIGVHEIVLIDTEASTTNTLDLGSDVNTTAGLAVHPDGERGYVVHWVTPQLIEFSLETREVLRTVDLDFVDIRDVLVIEGITHPDCNGNGILDTQDIENRTSADENGDGVPDECTVAGDVTGDGVVGFADLLLVLSSWGPCAGCVADLDGDGDVSFADLLVVLTNWTT